MKIRSSQITKITFSEIKGLDPVDVILEDFSEGNGRIIISCYGESWSYHWGSMGSTVSEFFCSTNNQYLVSKMLGNRTDTDHEYLDRIVSTVKIGLEMMKAMEIAADPLPNTAPEMPPLKQWAKIEADEI